MTAEERASIEELVEQIREVCRLAAAIDPELLSRIETLAIEGDRAIWLHSLSEAIRHETARKRHLRMLGHFGRFALAMREHFGTAAR